MPRVKWEPFFLHMVEALPPSIQDRFCMVQRTVNTKENCFAHVDTACYMLEVKVDAQALNQSTMHVLTKTGI